MEAFYELLQIALGHQEKLGHILSCEEWTKIFVTSQKQSVTGVAFMALEKLLSQGQKIPSELLFEWIGLSEQIKARNKMLNRHCYEVSRMIAEAGFRSCILKGQGNALLYDAGNLRTSGDIDIWVEGSREEVYNFVVSKFPDVRDGYLHIDFPIFKDVPVEIHYKPGYSKVPKYEKRLQAWFMEQANEQFTHKTMLEGHEVCVPTARFNVVQQMQHMMRHFVVEGIGMRHLIDYFFVLRKLHAENTDGIEFEETFRFLGMRKFARGVMWIEKEILGIDEKMLLVPASERIGRIILDSVMEGGNFGHHREANSIRRKNVKKRGLIDAYRMIKILPVQPSEVIYRLIYKSGNVRSLKKAFC